MTDKHKFATSQLFNFAQDSYLERTSRPIYAIIFLLPFIIFYELGTIFINTNVLSQIQVRVVAFVWLQNLLEYLGTGSRVVWIAPPLAVVAILVALQLTSRKQWYFSLGDICPMAIECVLLAVPLIVLSLFLSSPAQPQSHVTQSANLLTQMCSETVPSHPLAAIENLLSVVRQSAGNLTGNSLLADIVTGIGAGIYEELVFRLILISLLMLLFQDLLKLSHSNSIIVSVLVSAALFSAHHHIVIVNGQLATSAAFNWTEFGFRTVAGIYFALLFAIRGFGITAGTHAFYDIIATVINATFFR